MSDQKLGSMAEPVRVTHKGQEFKLCCKGCNKKIFAEADKYLEKVAAATKKQPLLGSCPVQRVRGRGLPGAACRSGDCSCIGSSLMLGGATM